MEGLDGIRSDSPTAEIESHNLVFSFAASNRLVLKTADISNAYFQGELLDRVLLLKPPKSGVPDDEYSDGNTMILARVPIYGTADAGRKLWKKFNQVITANKYRECKIARALYVLEFDNDIKGLLITHVDDLCYCVMPEYEEHINNILREFAVNEDKMATRKFRFCGKEIEQDSDYNVTVACRDTTEQIGPARYTVGSRKPDDKATDKEVEQMRSVIGSLGWIARQCQPDISYDVSSSQGAVSRAPCTLR